MAMRTKKRRAAPNSMSGLNPNTPIRLYETHPNQRFGIGDQVLKIDPEEPDVLGKVLGHVAEDRVWVQWPHTASQEDVDDVISLQEWSFGSRDSANPRHDLPIERKKVHPKGITSRKRRKKRTALLPQSMGGTGVPTQLGGKGTFQQQQLADPNYNPFGQPAVQNLLLKAGLNPTDIGAFTQLYSNIMTQRREQIEQHGLGQGQQQATPVTQENISQQGGVPAGTFAQPIPVGQPASVGTQQLEQLQQMSQPISEQPGGPLWPPGMQPTSARRRGITALLHTAKLIEGLGHRKAAAVIRETADVAAALHDLYGNKRTRAASRDKTAQAAMKRAILGTLSATVSLRNKKVGLSKAAKDVEHALLDALTYPRI